MSARHKNRFRCMQFQHICYQNPIVHVVCIYIWTENLCFVFGFRLRQVSGYVDEMMFMKRYTPNICGKKYKVQFVRQYVSKKINRVF